MPQIRMTRPTHATVVAYLALFVAMSGTAVAATGGTFLLGRSNRATATTALTNSAGVPLRLNAKTGYAPLSVNSGIRVPYLNADRLDGLDSGQLQRRVTGTCVGAIGSIGSTGAVGCRVMNTTVVTSGVGNLGGSVQCPVGSKVVGGGYDFPTLSGYQVLRSYPDDFGQYWTVYAENPVSPYQVNGTVYAVCQTFQ